MNTSDLNEIKQLQNELAKLKQKNAELTHICNEQKISDSFVSKNGSLDISTSISEQLNEVVTLIQENTKDMPIKTTIIVFSLGLLLGKLSR